MYVGDPSLSDAGWATLGMLGEGVVPLRVTLDERFEFLYGTLHRDRVDSSPYVFRSVNSRNDDVLMQRLSLLASELEPSICERRKGDIILSLPAYGRYVGELEIARSTMPPDSRIAVIGNVADQDLELLPLICDGLSVKLVRSH